VNRGVAGAKNKNEKTPKQNFRDSGADYKKLNLSRELAPSHQGCVSLERHNTSLDPSF
jgi:hypothetical protein